MRHTHYFLIREGGLPLFTELPRRVGVLGNPHGPGPLLKRYVAAGRLGRKSGRGFYQYG
jgi:3-hydroxyacyl-CoA dehydrogenase